MCRWCASAILLCALLLAPLGRGAQAAPAPKSAQEYVQLATELFQKGAYDEAVDAYYAAYQRKALPTLLFNVAQAQRKGGHPEQALASYERFLREDPKSPLAPEAEAHATALRAQLEAAKNVAEREAAERLAKQRAEEAEALAKAREEERKKAEAALLLASASRKQEPVYKKKWFWGLIGGLAAAGIVTGVVVAVTRPGDPSSDLGVRVVEF